LRPPVFDRTIMSCGLRKLNSGPKIVRVSTIYSPLVDSYESWLRAAATPFGGCA
jgi:hypothetical protein